MRASVIVGRITPKHCCAVHGMGIAIFSKKKRFTWGVRHDVNIAEAAGTAVLGTLERLSLDDSFRKTKAAPQLEQKITQTRALESRAVCFQHRQLEEYILSSYYYMVEKHEGYHRRF